LAGTDETFRVMGLSPIVRERAADCRRYPRVEVTWPVTVDTGDSLFHLETLNLSLFGAKLRLDSPGIEPGLPARLHFRPPAGPPLEVLAIVWRTDPDGPAFFFISIESSELTFIPDKPEPDPPGC
jgi:hypothetical protein